MPVFHHPHSKKFVIPSLNQPFFSLPLVQLQKGLLKSLSPNSLSLSLEERCSIPPVICMVPLQQVHVLCAEGSGTGHPIPQNEAQEIPFKCRKDHFHCKGSKALA